MQLHTGPFFPSFLFSSRCQSLEMLDIRSGMVLKQTHRCQCVGKSFLSAIKVERKYNCEIVILN